MKDIKQYIEKLLRTGKSFDDFLAIYNIYLTYLDSLDGKTRIPLERKRFEYLFRTLNRQYVEFTIPKKNGEERVIFAPKSQLKRLQKKLTEILELTYIPHKACHGFVKGRSIVTNAEIHTNKNYVLNIDLNDFFPSIKYLSIKTILKSEPFFYSEDMANIFARIACKEGQLPQGSPMSPIISNICCTKLDEDLTEFAQLNKLSFTRYADDITFSGYRPIFNSTFFTSLGSIIGKGHQFRIKKSKTRIQSKNKRQEVTGLVVNDKLNVNRDYVRNLRAMIHYYNNGKAPKNAFNVISGKLEFLKMVKGKERVYKNLLEQFNKQRQ
jgi:RNA-directed DNA polymerase